MSGTKISFFERMTGHQTRKKIFWKSLDRLAVEKIRLKAEERGKKSGYGQKRRSFRSLFRRNNKNRKRSALYSEYIYEKENPADTIKKILACHREFTSENPEEKVIILYSKKCISRKEIKFSVRERKFSFKTRGIFSGRKSVSIKIAGFSTTIKKPFSKKTMIPVYYFKKVRPERSVWETRRKKTDEQKKNSNAFINLASIMSTNSVPGTSPGNTADEKNYTFGPYKTINEKSREWFISGPGKPAEKQKNG